VAVADAAYEHGVDFAQFGPVMAACIGSQSADMEVNFILGGGEAGAVENGHLADAAAWLESRCLQDEGRVGVDYRVSIIPGLPDSTAAEDWLRARGDERGDGSMRLVRDTAPPQFDLPAGVTTLDWDEWDEGFSGPLAHSLDLPWPAESFFYCLLEMESDTWSTYGAVDAEGPLAYAAMHRHAGVATLALGSLEVEGREGQGQMALLHRCITDAAQSGCDTIMIASAGQEPPAADRRSFTQAGFEPAFRVPSWCHSRVAVTA